MNRLMLACVAILFLPAPAIAQESPRAIKLSSLMLDLGRLESGEQRYTYRAQSPASNEQAVKGTVVFAMEVKNDTVILRDTMELTVRGNRWSLDLVHHCRKNNYLSPAKIESTGQGDDEVATFVAVIEDGKATVRVGGQERIIDIPADTVTFSAFVRLLPLLPREKGIRISFPHWLESSELNLKQDFVTECLGEEAITRGDQELPCTKYRLTSGQIMPTEAWVDSRGILQRLLIDRRKVIDLVQE